MPTTTTTTNTQAIDRLAYSVPQAAYALSVSPNTVRNMIRDGELDAARIRDRVVVPRRALEDLLRAR